jgi:hypothetical protein
LPSIWYIGKDCRYPTSRWPWCPNERNDYSSNLIGYLLRFSEHRINSFSKLIACFLRLSKYRKFHSNYFSNLIGCFIWLSEYSNEYFSNLIRSSDHSHCRQRDYDIATVFFAYRNFGIIKQLSANDDK